MFIRPLLTVIIRSRTAQTVCASFVHSFIQFTGKLKENRRISVLFFCIKQKQKGICFSIFFFPIYYPHLCAWAAYARGHKCRYSYLNGSPGDREMETLKSDPQNGGHAGGEHFEKYFSLYGYQNVTHENMRMVLQLNGTKTNKKLN